MNAARNNTATATTATAEVVGRFAPSPTGPLHAGSLLAAVGSYLHARANNGRWLLRIEDVDTTRSQAQAETQILRTLEAFGFEWHGAVLRQSSRVARYAAAVEQLLASGAVFRCVCSRRQINAAANNAALHCVSHCERRQQNITGSDFALRWRPAAGTEAQFDDIWQGSQNVSVAAGADVVLRRRDGLHAYHLAVIIDDADQGVTQVVRGADLLDSTGWHLLLQQALSLPAPQYGHLPLLVGADGHKLSKTQQAFGLQNSQASAQLYQCLQRLRQQPPAELSAAPTREIWAWALAHWLPEALRGLRTVAL